MRQGDTWQRQVQILPDGQARLQHGMLKRILGDAIEMIIDGGPVGIGLESTIVDFTEDVPVVLRPGYISLEMLQEVLGDVRMDKGLIKPDSKVHPKAPGMKYRHYAPKADLAIVEGPTEEVINAINQFVKEDQANGLQVGIIANRRNNMQISLRNCEEYRKQGGRGNHCS